MRRASALGALVLLLALALGLGRMNSDIADEVDAAMALAGVMARLGELAAAGTPGQADERAALQALRDAQAAHPLRHLSLQVHAADGRLLLGPPAPEPAAAPLRWLLALHQHWLSVPDARRVAWPVARPDGSRWTVSLTASHDSERREAMGSLLGMLGLLLLGVSGLLAVMHWNVRQAFAPLGRLLQAIAGIEGHDARPVQALPTMPTRELESVAAALRHLAMALDAAEAERRRLSQQLLTLQDEERARLAQELHDEFGQRLTALRVDAAWLARRLGDDSTLQPVAAGMAAQCALVQQDIRGLLGRLQPFGPASQVVADGVAVDSLAAGMAQLQALVHSWQPSGGRADGPACQLVLDWHGNDGVAVRWPSGTAAGQAGAAVQGAGPADALGLPRALWLTLYRISQEALTNVARHAQARQVVLHLQATGPQLAGAALSLTWRVSDDGVGAPDVQAVLPRGNGLAGMRQRVWAQDADLRMGPARPGAARPGWQLEAEFHTRLLALPGPGVAPPPHTQPAQLAGH